jgi:hypothetical protein
MGEGKKMRATIERWQKRVWFGDGSDSECEYDIPNGINV